MKKIVLIAIAFALSGTANAQIQTPAPSPAAKLEQMVGLTKITIDYSRPAMRGREIFGNLVPFGKLWRTGANKRNKNTFDKTITIGGTNIKAGSYSFFTIPNANEWEVIFYSEYNKSGAPAKLDETKVVARLKITTQKLSMDIQSFTMTIDDVTNSSASIGVFWENTYVAIPFTVDTDKSVMASIEKNLNGTGTKDYYTAASYYYSQGKDMAKAKQWIDTALKMVKSPAFWQLRQQSLIYFAAGDKNGAIKLAEKSLAASKEAGNNDYIKMNNDSIAEWSK
jgi:tetratricopeptide (TPR) repeat protein